MATEIGIIKMLIGTAVAISADGSQHSLHVGDKLFADEIVSTGALGAVEVEFNDGSVMDLGRNSQAMLDNDIFDPQHTSQVQADVQDSVDALQQAILAGDDPTQGDNVPATAAGAGAPTGNEGSTTVTVDYLAPVAPVTSGFDTTGPTVVFPPLVENIQQGAVNGSPIAVNDGAVNVLNASNTVFEDLADYNSPAGTGAGFINTRAEYVPQTSTGNLFSNDNFGPDGAGGLVAVNYTGTSAGVTGSFSAGVAIFQMADPVGTGSIWTLTVNPDGSYNFTLDKPYIHSQQGADIAHELFSYTIADANGDTASANLTLNIVDDVPHVTTTAIADVAYEFTMTNHDDVSSAGYHNSYGYYVKAADGTPLHGAVVWQDVHNANTPDMTVAGYSPDQIGFFIIPNGGNRNGSLTDGDQVTFSQDSQGHWQATLQNGTSLVGNGSNVLFDAANLNNDNQDHLQDNSLIGNQNWEDLQIPNGDGDYNDVNTNVAWSHVTTTGTGLGDVSYGADGAGSINFTLGDVSITGGLLTTNGANIEFVARDTNSDGINDQVVGQIAAGQTGAGETVLTIDGILDNTAHNVTLFSGHPIDQANTDLTINTNVQVTDGDGDTTGAALHLNVNIVSDYLPPVDPTPPTL